MRRSQDSELAERINTAIALLRKGSSGEEAVSEIMGRFGVSRRQAYRYIRQAQSTKRKVPVPEQKVVFTVKLPGSLVSFMRQLSDSTEESLSDLVTQALKTFLRRRGYGRKAS
jgi:transposase-like protein